MYYKESILCLLFAMAEADEKFDEAELASIITMKEIFKGYAEHDIVNLFKEYRTRFAEATFSEICAMMLKHLPKELHLGTLSLMADIAVVDFDVDIKESALMSIVANAMGISDTAMKTLLLAALSKKLLMDMGQEQI